MEKFVEFIGAALITIIFIILPFAGLWKVSEKGGHPGLAIVVPFYNVYIYASLAGISPWSMLVLLVPGFNLIFLLIFNYKVAKNFGRGIFFSLGLTFLWFIFWPILGFGDDQFLGNVID